MCTPTGWTRTARASTTETVKKDADAVSRRTLLFVCVMEKRVRGREHTLSYLPQESTAKVRKQQITLFVSLSPSRRFTTNGFRWIRIQKEAAAATTAATTTAAAEFAFLRT